MGDLASNEHIPANRAAGAFGVSVQVTDAGTTLQVHGELDAVTAPELADYLDATLAIEPGAIVVDLAAVGFIGSAGVGLLVKANDHARERGRPLTVLNASSAAKRIFELVGVEVGHHLESV